MLINPDEIVISPRTFRSIVKNPEKTASAVNLVYVNDAVPGIRRVRKGKKFTYLSGKKKISGEDLDRIKRLVIPPAWENVWICGLENGHLQATGIDLKKRKQYKYHALWNTLRNHTKFYRLSEFGKLIPGIRKRIETDLGKPGLPIEKVLACVVSLMEMTSIRVGNNVYEKLYGSFGLTTLKDQHVKFNGPSMKFIFRGKKGIHHDISIKSKKLSKIVRQCRDIPGKELFQYVDEEGNYRRIDSGMVNDYIQEICGSDYSAKDFRTWAGTVQALRAFKEFGICDTLAEVKKNIIAALDAVAGHLGNTRTVCRKYYVHPVIISLYENKKLHKYLDELQHLEKCDRFDLECEEKLLLRILEKERQTIRIQ